VSRRTLIAIVGDGSIEPGSAKEKLAEDMGRAVVDAGWCVLTGGLGGVMTAACRGARSSAAHTPGSIIGLLPRHDPADANEWIDVALPTGLDLARNLLLAHADAVVAIGGGAGTLVEMAAAWELHRLLIAFRVDGWSGRLADQPIDHRIRFPGTDDRVFGVDRAEQAIALLRERLPLYRMPHRWEAR
jgi:uncharacterized protein (TIGR00725 family)